MPVVTEEKRRPRSVRAGGCLVALLLVPLLIAALLVVTALFQVTELPVPGGTFSAIHVSHLRTYPTGHWTESHFGPSSVSEVWSLNIGRFSWVFRRPIPQQ